MRFLALQSMWLLFISTHASRRLGGKRSDSSRENQPFVLKLKRLEGTNAEFLYSCYENHKELKVFRKPQKSSSREDEVDERLREFFESQGSLSNPGKLKGRPTMRCHYYWIQEDDIILSMIRLIEDKDATYKSICIETAATHPLGKRRGLMQELIHNVKTEARKRELPLFIMSIDTTLAVWRDRYGFVKELSAYSEHWANYHDVHILRYINAHKSLRIYPTREDRRAHRVVGRFHKDEALKLQENGETKCVYRFYFKYAIRNPTRKELDLKWFRRMQINDPIMYLDSKYDRKLYFTCSVDAHELWSNSMKGKTYIQKQHPHEKFADYSINCGDSSEPSDMSSTVTQPENGSEGSWWAWFPSWWA